MNILCKIFGHKWIQCTSASDREHHMVICMRHYCEEELCRCPIEIKFLKMSKQDEEFLNAHRKNEEELLRAILKPELFRESKRCRNIE